MSSGSKEEPSLPVQPEPLSALDRAAALVSNSMEDSFGALGLAVAARPWLTIFLSMLCVAICSAGLMSLTPENRTEELWVPPDTEAQGDKNYVEDNYPYPSRIGINMVILKERRDILYPDIFDDLHKIHQDVIKLEGDNDGTIYSYNDVCEIRGEACNVRGVLKIFEYNSSKWDTREKILAEINRGNLTNIAGDAMDIQQVIGGVTFDENDMIIKAEAASNFYFLKNQQYLKDGNFIDPIAESWEKSFLEKMEDLDKDAAFGAYDIERFAERSFDDEFGRAIDSDLLVLNVAVTMIIVYACTMLSKFSHHALGVRCMITVAAVLTVVMAILSSYGFLSVCGLFFSPLMGALPFLLIGIGIDDAFVIMHQFDLTSPTQSTSMRIKETMEMAGPSIALTSLTDLFAFMIGANTTLPALQYFCIFAGVGVLFDFILQITFFVGCLSIDCENKRKGYADLAYLQMCHLDLEQVQGTTMCGCRKREKGVLARIMSKMAVTLTDTRAKAAVVLVALGLAGGGIAGSIMIEVDSDITNFFPFDLYGRDFLGASDEYFNAVGGPAAVYIKDGVDYTSSDTWQGLRDLFEAFRNTEYVAADTCDSWFYHFEQEYTFTSETFYSQLDLFLAGSGSNYNSSDIVWKNGLIYSTRMRGNHEKTNTTQEEIDSMDNLREAASEVAHIGDKTFAYVSSYLFTEQYKSIIGEAAMNLSMAMLAVAFVVTILVVNPIASALVILCVGIVVCDVVGFMYFWGLGIDSITIVMLVVALGLSVDYAAHVGHAYMHKQGTPDQRLIACLEQMGTAVFNGAMSTFIAVVVLAGSQSYVFIAFFKQLFLCCTFGSAHGLILLPVLLSLAAPKATVSEHKTIIEMAEQKDEVDVVGSIVVA